MEVDIENYEALQDYLEQKGHVKPGERVSFESLVGGVSNRTVRIAWADGDAWVLKQALAKLRVNVDWFSSPKRIGVEARALRWLNGFAPPGATPAFIFEDADNHLLAMEAIAAKHDNWKSLLLSGKIVTEHFEQSGILLGTIHRRSSERKAELMREFEDTAYFENLRLEPYYLYTGQKTLEAASFLNLLAHETLRHKISLVHGDFSPKNILIYQEKLILLDYEVVHFGDPAFDVGFLFAHFLSKAHHLRLERARLANAAGIFWQVYFREIASLDWGKNLEPRVIRHALACLLARVDGKSPLEYLTPQEAMRQRETVLSLIAAPPTRVNDLIAEFVRRIGNHAEN